MPETTLAPAPLTESILHLLPRDDDEVADETTPILVQGEREAFARTFTDRALYPDAALPPTIQHFTEMQAAARDMSHARRSYVLAAPTSSGKTLAFAAPIFEAGRPAVFVYPYRALLLDQASELLDVAGWFGYGARDFGYLMGGVGRAEIADQVQGRFLLATPDKLISLFMAAERDQMTALRILASADFVFDEVHAYSPMMIRSLVYFIRSVRLWHERISAGRDVASKPSFVFSSATIPDELWRELSAGLGMTEDDRITGPSNTGDARVEIAAPRAPSRTGGHPVAGDMAERDAVGHAMVVMNDPFSAYQICRAPELAGRTLLFVGQDKQPEEERRAHLQMFADHPEDHVLVGSSAIEAGVDMAARHLFMEAAFSDSTVQRFGRAARSGRDASVMIYGSELKALLRAGHLRRTYTRREFNELLAAVHPERPRARLLTGLAAGPYMRFWKGQAARIVEPEDRAFHERLAAEGDPELLAFRSLSPYTRYESGESIGFAPLFRKNLPLLQAQDRRAGRAPLVQGRPSVDRYFNAKRRGPVRVDLVRVAHREQTEVVRDGRAWPVTLVLAEGDFGPFGRHWAVFEIGPAGPDTPDNMILRLRGRDLNGPGARTPEGHALVARFYG